MSVIAQKVNGKVHILPSQHTPDWTDKDCIINPILPNCPVKYMDIVDGKVIEVNDEQKKVIDAAIQAEIDRQLEIGEI